MNLDVRFIDAPRVVGRFELGADALFELGSKALGSAVDGGVVDMEAALGHHFCEVTVAEGIPQVPAHAKQNDRGCVMPPFERILLVQCRCLHSRCSRRSTTVADAAISCNRARASRFPFTRSGALPQQRIFDHLQASRLRNAHRNAWRTWALYYWGTSGAGFLCRAYDTMQACVNGCIRGRHQPRSAALSGKCGTRYATTN